MFFNTQALTIRSSSESFLSVRCSFLTAMGLPRVNKTHLNKWRYYTSLKSNDWLFCTDCGEHPQNYGAPLRVIDLI